MPSPQRAQARMIPTCGLHAPCFSTIPFTWGEGTYETIAGGHHAFSQIGVERCGSSPIVGALFQIVYGSWSERGQIVVRPFQIGADRSRTLQIASDQKGIVGGSRQMQICRLFFLN
eukprot:4024812-Pleurochrysis_carterae.AAC.1